jgi:hypothetical protein
MPTRLVRARLLALVAAIPIALAAPALATAQDPALEVFYTKLEPKEQFKYKWKGKEAVCSAGVFRWEVPETEFGTNGLDRNFTGYCAEVRVPITAEKLYRFRVNSLYDVKNYEGLANKEGMELAAQKRVVYIRELFGRYFRDPVLKSVNPDEAIALQIALWEVIQESEPAEGKVKFDLFGGDFQANYPPAEAPAYVKTAQQYLDSLVGDDKFFYENPDLRGRELIRLQGIPNADNVVAQSQFALRYMNGGASSSGNLTGALTSGVGLAPLGGIGGPGTGFGGLGTGGGSGFLSTNPGGGVTTTTPPTTTPPTTTPPTQPPINTPPINSPPDTTPETPNNPVPAPAGLLLGGIALGTLGVWRIGVRLLSPK